MANLNVRVDDDIKMEFDIAVTRGRTTLQAAVKEAIESWMADKQNKGQSANALTPHEAAHVAALLYALRTQNETKIHQIQLMLKPFLGKTEEPPAKESPNRRKSA